MNKYPLPQIEEMTKGKQEDWPGVMGFADVLFKLGIPIIPMRAVELARKVMSFIHERSKEMSEHLAGTRGGVFPYYDKSTYKNSGRQKAQECHHHNIALQAP